jgi:homoserine O-acetyltransferase
MSKFPRVRIGDDVVAQERLLREQFAGTAQNTPHDFLLAELTREALMSDPGWNGGEYASSAEVAAGLIRQAHVWAVVGLSTEFWKWQRGDVARHADGDLAAALDRVKAKTFVMPIEEDLLFPVRDCAPEQAMISGSELRVIEDIHGHLALFGADPGYMPQIDRYLSELLATPV